MIATDHGGGQLALWDVSQRSSPRLLSDALTIDGEHGRFALGWSPNGRAILALAGGEGVRIIDVTDPAEPRRSPSQANALTGIAVMSWAPDGKTSALMADEEGSLWDFSRLTAARRLGDMPEVGFPLSVDWLGDGLVATSDYRGVALWDVERLDTPRQLGLYSLESALAFPTSAGMLADDRTMLLTGLVDDIRSSPSSRDDAAVFLDLGEIVDTRNNLVQRACAMLGRDLTREEWSANVPGRSYEETCGT